MTVFDRFFDMIPVPFHQRLDTSVREIPHPPPETKLDRDVTGKCTVEDPLHSAPDYNMDP